MLFGMWAPSQYHVPLYSVMSSWCQRHGAKSNKKGWKETAFADFQKRYWPREEQRNRNTLIGRVGRYFAYYSIILKHTI